MSLDLMLHTHSCIPSVPVIGIFTKLDGRMDIVMDTVLPNPSRSDYLHPPQEVEEKVAKFIDGLERKFRNQLHPPAAFVSVGSMCILSA
jgi:hypothetical protein